MPIERPQFTRGDLDAAIEQIRQKAIERLDEKGWGIYASSHETLGIVAEEYHELVEAVTEGAPAGISDELLDLAVAAYLGLASRGQQDW